MKPVRIVLAVTVLAVLAVLTWQGRFGSEPSRSDGSSAAPPVPLAELRDPADRLTIAATGDTLVGARFSASDGEVGSILQRASLAITDLEQRLQDDEADLPGASGRRRWPAGGPGLARELRQLGFTFVTLANNHAGDDGGDGVERAGRILTGAGLRHAGAAADLTAARSAVTIGAAPRRVAVIAVATSVPPAMRATPRRGDVAGRPGVNTLRYIAVVTADPQTFAALAQIAQTSTIGDVASAAGGTLSMSGTVIKRGKATAVDLVADAQDLSEILAGIKSARANADVVVVSLHSHEPGNRSEAPADFVQAFARQAIDAGATLVIGHGPRQLRGIEIYRSGAILYSLGNFAFRPSQIEPGSANVFDTDASAYDLALGALQHPEQLALPSYDEPVWWESAIATATFDGSALTQLTLSPLELGRHAAEPERGSARVAKGTEARAILQRLEGLSKAYGTTITLQGDEGVILMPPHAERHDGSSR
jgi:poly-gamma-glutamate synthesis protein (capsule biosynthesis protein)